MDGLENGEHWQAMIAAASGTAIEAGTRLVSGTAGTLRLLTSSEMRVQTSDGLSYFLQNPGTVLGNAYNDFRGLSWDKKLEAFYLAGTDFAVGAKGVGRTRGGTGDSIVPDSEFWGARGVHSTREFDPAAAGGPLRELSADNIKFTEKGISVVEKHTSRFGPDPANDYMIDRLRGIANGEIEATAVDRNFYSHELREYVRYRRLGWETGQPTDLMQQRDLWNNTHTATLEEYSIKGPNTDPYLYHPEAIKLMGDF